MLGKCLETMDEDGLRPIGINVDNLGDCFNMVVGMLEKTYPGQVLYRDQPASDWLEDVLCIIINCIRHLVWIRHRF